MATHTREHRRVMGLRSTKPASIGHVAARVIDVGLLIIVYQPGRYSVFMLAECAAKQAARIPQNNLTLPNTRD
jgi:hypothetical protein